MSNPQPSEPQSSFVTDVSPSPDSLSMIQPSGVTTALKGQFLLAMGGTVYAALHLNLSEVALGLVTGGLTGFSLLRLSRQPALSLQPDEPQVPQNQPELTRLAAINRALQDQLIHQAALQDQLQHAEAAVLQAEKMATLGTLMAGVAHEINTPLGAIQASAENLEFSVSQTLGCLPQLCHTLNEEQLAAFSQLLTWAGEDHFSRSSREERQLKRELKAQLEALEIENARSIAAVLSPMGIGQNLTEILPLLRSPQVDLILDAAYNLHAIQANGSNIGVAIGRANNIVASLRNYARKGSQSQPCLSDLRMGLETVLTLYQNKLKHGVDVQKHYDDVPQLLCHPEELDQAWANLIGNAIQAMEGQGQLEIALGQQDDRLVVSITDSGPGIPAAAQAEIFTPYFTTKPMGEGSGLGLSITQKIIERHGGNIELDSAPGKTQFRVSLPLNGICETDSEASQESGLPGWEVLPEGNAGDMTDGLRGGMKTAEKQEPPVSLASASHSVLPPPS